MKAFFMAAAIAAASVLAAEEIRINGNFDGSKPDAAAPAGWVKNQYGAGNVGTSRVIAGTESGTFAISVKTTTLSMPFYTASGVPVTPGDRIEMQADVKGKGQVRLLAYTYNQKNIFVSNIVSVPVKPDVPGKVKGMIVIPQKIEYAYIRLVFEVMSGSDVTISNIRAEFKISQKN